MKNALGFDYMCRSAELSEDGLYRFTLERTWFDEGDPSDPCTYITYIGLNPSTADANFDDPTIRRLIQFTRDFGYKGFEIRNLYALRCTDPDKVDRSKLISLDNESVLSKCRGEKIVLCYGKNRNWPDWYWIIRKLELWYTDQLYCFGRNKDGSPKHPLYLKGTTKLQKW